MTDTRVKPLYTFEEIANILDVSQDTVKRLVREGRLKKVKIGRRVFIRDSDLNDFIESLTDDDTPVRPNSKNSRAFTEYAS